MTEIDIMRNDGSGNVSFAPYDEAIAALIAQEELEGELEHATLEIIAKAYFKTVSELKESIEAEKVARASDENAGAAYEEREDRTDAGNVNLMIRLAGGDIRYIPEAKVWIEWDGNQWVEDKFGSIAQKRALEVAKYYVAKAGDIFAQARDNTLSAEEKKKIIEAATAVSGWAKACREIKRLGPMIGMASKDKRVQLSFSRLNSDPYLFGVANGVVDLRTGQLRPNSRDDFITKRSPFKFNPNAKCPRWELFITEITSKPISADYDDDGKLIEETVGRAEARPELAAYLRKVFGYFTTGVTKEQKLFVFIGPGANGKGVGLDTFKYIAGPYAVTAMADVFMVKKTPLDADKPTPSTAMLSGARVAVCSEVKKGSKFDANAIKQHTGEMEMTSRFLNGNFFTFPITHKGVIQVNHQPPLDHLDPAIKGRLHLVPFLMRWNRPGEVNPDPALPNADKMLMDTLRDEAEGILAWLVWAARDYFAKGLDAPPEVIAVTSNYFERQDPIGQWLKHYQRCDPRNGTRAAALYDHYREWKKQTDFGEHQGPGTNKAFSTELMQRNISKKADNSNGTKYGIVLKTVAKAEKTGNENDPIGDVAPMDDRPDDKPAEHEF
jgi:putative DNA primase/helicase